MTFITLVVFAFLFYTISSISSLKQRVGFLEEELSRHQGDVVINGISAQSSPAEMLEEREPVPLADNGLPLEQWQEPLTESLPSFLSPQPQADRPEPVRFERREEYVSEEFFLYTWFKEQTLIKIGAIIFFLGAVWFVSYAIEQQWISPLTRILLGLCLALGMYGIGHGRRDVALIQYQVLTSLGSAVFLGTVIASQFAFVVPVLPAWFAFMLMIGSIIYTLAVAYRTSTEWLAVASAVAGLIAPFLVKVDVPAPTMLLVYLLLLSAGFSLIVFLTKWSNISLTLLIGVGAHLLLLNATQAINEHVLWLFVILFSAVFFAGTTVGILRSDRLRLVDVSLVVLIALQYIGYAVSIALLPELALFAGAAVAAGVGYVLRMRNASPMAVALFAATSLVGILVATTKMFDGYALTIVFALEVLVVYIFSLRVATMQRSVQVAALLFILPIVSGFFDLQAPVWRSGILHAEALSVLTVLLTLGVAVVWSMRAPVLQAIDWLRQTVAALLVGWYCFALMTSSVVADSISDVHSLSQSAMTSLLFTVIAGLVLWYVLSFVAHEQWRYGAVYTLIAPVLGALAVLADSAWMTGIFHLPLLAGIAMMVTLAVAAVYYLVSGQRSDNEVETTTGYILVWVLLVYGFFLLMTVWEALLDGDDKRVATATSCALLVYLLVHGLMWLRLQVQRIALLLVAFAFPIITMVPSLHFLGWYDGVFGIDAVGLYVLTTLAYLLGVAFSQYRTLVNGGDVVLAGLVAHGLYWGTGVMIVLLTWIGSHTIVGERAVAVTVALFLYTVAGLLAYTYGRSHRHDELRRAGFLLLSVVILRLGLVDVWAMEMVWRIVTMLGIGSLFIVAALLEGSQLRSLFGGESKNNSD